MTELPNISEEQDAAFCRIAEQIAEEIVKGYESDSGTVLGIPWIHRPALSSLLAIAAQRGLETQQTNGEDNDKHSRESSSRANR